MILLLACAAVATRPPVNLAPVGVTEPPPARAVSPPGWQSGQVDAPALRTPPREKWERTFDAPVTNALAADDSGVYIAAPGKLVALAVDGTLRWTVRGDLTGPALITSQGVWAPFSDRMRLLDARSGEVLSEAPLELAPDTGAAPSTSGIAWVTFEGTVVDARGWHVSVGGRAAGPPATDGDRAYAATRAGDLAAVGAEGVEWSAVIGAPASAGPALDTEAVYVPFGARDRTPGGVLAMERSGAERWRWYGNVEPGAPLAVGSRLYVPERGDRLVALDRRTGALAWEVDGFAPFVTRPILTQSFLYAASADGTLHAIDTADGGVVWTLPLGSAPTADPVLAGGLLYFALADGRVVALGT